jgi:hypothetical protein
MILLATVMFLTRKLHLGGLTPAVPAVRQPDAKVNRQETPDSRG